MSDDMFSIGNTGIPTMDDMFPSQKARKRTGEPFALGDIGYGAVDDVGSVDLFGSSQPRKGKIYRKGKKFYTEDPRYPGSNKLVRLKYGKPVFRGRIPRSDMFGGDMFGSVGLPSQPSYGTRQADMFDLGSIGIPDADSISANIRNDIKTSAFYPRQKKQKQSPYLLPEERRYKVRQAAPGVYAVKDPSGKLVDINAPSKKEAYQYAREKNIEAFEDYQYESSRTNYDKAVEGFRKLKAKLRR